LSGSVLTNLYRQWIWLGIPFMVGALMVLGTVIRRVIAIVRKAHLFRVPPAETQEVVFTEAGSVILSIEGPRFTRRFAHVGFELMDATGQRVPSRPTLFRARTSGISTVRMELRAFNIPRPGRYVLRMTSLGPAREKDREHAVVFMRPHLGSVVACILGIVLSSALFIVSLVFFLLRLLGAGSGQS